MSRSIQLCTFRLESLLLGVEVAQVQEVLKFQQMTPVPGASNAIAGLINLRGQIVTAIDLRRRFDLDRPDSPTTPMNVVVREGGGIVSLLVDEIGDVVEVTAETFEPSIPTLREPARSLIRGVHKLQDDLLLVLDVGATLDFDASRVPAPQPVATGGNDQ